MNCNPEHHTMHMCTLKSKGEGYCIKSLSDKPAVECHYCSAKANDAGNVCDPKPLRK